MNKLQTYCCPIAESGNITRLIRINDHTIFFCVEHWALVKGEVIVEVIEESIRAGVKQALKKINI